MLRTAASCLQVGLHLLKLAQIDNRRQQRPNATTSQQKPEQEPVVHSVAPVPHKSSRDKGPTPQYGTCNSRMILSLVHEPLDAKIKTPSRLSASHDECQDKSHFVLISDASRSQTATRMKIPIWENSPGEKRGGAARADPPGVSLVSRGLISWCDGWLHPLRRCGRYSPAASRLHRMEWMPGNGRAPH